MAELAERALGAAVSEVRIGLGYTAVMLADGSLGVAFTFREQARGGCTVFDGLRPLRNRPASDLLALLESVDPIEAGVGMACANALANRAGVAAREGDVLEHLDIRSDDQVAMVGHFGPLVKELKRRARSLTVFEKVTKPSRSLRPAHEAVEVLPSCQVALITATSIVNHTIDELLVAAKGCREVVLLGATTPLLPEPFSAAGVTWLSGVVVDDHHEVLRVVSEGGGMRLFKPYVSKVCMRVAPEEQPPRTDGP